MSNRIVTAVDCPYCNRGVYLNVPEFIAHDGDEHIVLHERPDQRVVTFDRCDPHTPPCPHLYLIDASCRLFGEDAQEEGMLDFYYEHPGVKALAEATGIRFGLDPASLPGRDDAVMLESHFVFQEIQGVGIFRTEAGKRKSCDINGEAIFIEDVARLHKELPKYHAQYAEWITAGCPRPERTAEEDDEYEFEEIDVEIEID